jgi:hypothetical protein
MHCYDLFLLRLCACARAQTFFVRAPLVVLVVLSFVSVLLSLLLVLVFFSFWFFSSEHEYKAIGSNIAETAFCATACLPTIKQTNKRKKEQTNERTLERTIDLAMLD